VNRGGVIRADHHSAGSGKHRGGGHTDALLVTTKEHAQDVKQIVEHMKAQGLEDVL